MRRATGWWGPGSRTKFLGDRELGELFLPGGDPKNCPKQHKGDPKLKLAKFRLTPDHAGKAALSITTIFVFLGVVHRCRKIGEVQALVKVKLGVGSTRGLSVLNPLQTSLDLLHVYSILHMGRLES